MDFTDMLSPEEQLVLARESDPWAGYEQDLNARREECERIIAKASAILTHDEIAALRYECGLDA